MNEKGQETTATRRTLSLLNAVGTSPRETGLFLVHARWCPRGSRKGA